MRRRPQAIYGTIPLSRPIANWWYLRWWANRPRQNRAAHALFRSTTHRRGSTQPVVASGSLLTSSRRRGLGLRGGVLPCVSLGDKRPLDGIAGHLLHSFGPGPALAAVLRIGRRDVGRPPLPQGLHGRMAFRAPKAFDLSITRSRPAVRRRLPGAMIEEGGRGLCRAALRQPLDRLQLLPTSIQHAGLAPALLVHRQPGGRSCGLSRHAPPRADEPAPANADLPQAVLPLGASSVMRGKVRGTKAPPHP
jgi:hypothetical protein